MGGAGFASQVYTFPTPLKLPSMNYTGLHLTLLPPAQSSSASTKKTDDTEEPFEYTLVLKTGIPATRPDGRKESTINYEYSFPYPSSSSVAPKLSHDIPWSSFEETYRGKPIKPGQDGYEPLDPGRGITEVSFMCRSGFGKQAGDFELRVEGLKVNEGSSADDGWMSYAINLVSISLPFFDHALMSDVIYSSNLLALSHESDDTICTV